MDFGDVATIGLILGFVSMLYSAVGHGGASGYIAILALFAVAPETIRPVALALNVVVAGLATYRFSRAGYLNWKVAVPIIVASMPLAFVGGSITLPDSVYRPLLGVLLLISAIYLVWQVSAASTSFAEARRELPLAGSVAAGGGIGFLSGLSGIGGGVLLSPLFLVAGWSGARQTAGVAAVFILMNSIAGLAGNYTALRTLPTELIPWVLAVLIGSVAGTTLGVRGMPVRPLVIILSVAVGISGLKFLFL